MLCAAGDIMTVLSDGDEFTKSGFLLSLNGRLGKVVALLILLYLLFENSEIHTWNATCVQNSLSYAIE